MSKYGRKSTLLESLTSRVSTRSYNGKRLPGELRKIVLDYVKEVFKQPPLFDKDEETQTLRITHHEFELNTILISKAVEFLSIKVVTFCESYGVKTCWIGGKWLTKQLENHLIKTKQTDKLAENETGSRGLIDRVSSWWVGARSRNSPKKLFFDTVYGKSLKIEKKMEKVLECFRWAPSAVNKQPWKIIKEGNEYHFITCPSSTFYSNIDIGIGISNFHVACKELGIEGSFHRKEKFEIVLPNKGIYFMTWKEEIDEE